MRQFLTKAALLAVALASVVTVLPPTAHALQDEFRFKWPYEPGQLQAVTEVPFGGEHNCQTGTCEDAWDVLIANFRVSSSAEGVVTELDSRFDPNTCITTPSFGNFVRVRTATPTGDAFVRYAHLNSTAPALGSRVFQGD